nr:SIP domain-containing protein [Micrococcus luteus]
MGAHRTSGRRRRLPHRDGRLSSAGGGGVAPRGGGRDRSPEHRRRPRRAASHAARGRMDVVLEVPGRDHVPALEVPEGATLTVLHRGDAVPGALLTPHLEDLPAAPRDHVWACGEQSLATAARRVIVRRGIAPKRAIMFSGYWRVDGPRL